MIRQKQVTQLVAGDNLNLENDYFVSFTPFADDFFYHKAIVVKRSNKVKDGKEGTILHGAALQEITVLVNGEERVLDFPLGHYVKLAS